MDRDRIVKGMYLKGGDCPARVAEPADVDELGRRLALFKHKIDFVRGSERINVESAAEDRIEWLLRHGYI